MSLSQEGNQLTVPFVRGSSGSAMPFAATSCSDKFEVLNALRWISPTVKIYYSKCHMHSSGKRSQGSAIIAMPSASTPPVVGVIKLGSCAEGVCGLALRHSEPSSMPHQVNECFHSLSTEGNGFMRYAGEVIIAPCLCCQYSRQESHGNANGMVNPSR